MAEVRGMVETNRQAEAGMKLFKDDGPTPTDKPAAESFKATHDAKIAEMTIVINSLSGKDNKKERTAKSKELAEFKVDKQYIDACKVAKGLEPVNGFFVIGSVKKEVSAPPTEPVPTEPAKVTDPDAKKAAKPAKKTQSAGLSPVEKKELEQLKTDIIARKTQLKEQGLSGGQQNKDAQVAEWASRLIELKEKECPGSSQKPDKKEEKKKKVLSSGAAKQVESFRQEIEQYKTNLRSEFGYSNKDIKADPELQEMEKKLVDMEKAAR